MPYFLAESEAKQATHGKRPTSFCLWSLCDWNKAGLNYLIISELSEAEMEKLEDLLREQTD